MSEAIDRELGDMLRKEGWEIQTKSRVFKPGNIEANALKWHKSTPSAPNQEFVLKILDSLEVSNGLTVTQFIQCTNQEFIAFLPTKYRNRVDLTSKGSSPLSSIKVTTFEISLKDKLLPLSLLTSKPSKVE